MDKVHYWSKKTAGIKTLRILTNAKAEFISVVIHPRSFIEVHVFAKIMDCAFEFIQILRPVGLLRTGYTLYDLFAVANLGLGSLESTLSLDHILDVIVVRNDHSWL